MNTERFLMRFLNEPDKFDMVMGRLHELCKQTSDTFVVDAMKPYTILAGGFVVKIFQSIIGEYSISGRLGQNDAGFIIYKDENGNDVKTDVDFFITKRPPKSAIKEQFKLNKNIFKSVNKDESYFSNGKKRRAYTYFIDNSQYPTNPLSMVQYVPRIEKSNAEVINNFDFEHLKIFYDCATERLKYADDTLHHILLGDLKQNPKVWNDGNRYTKWRKHMTHYRKVVGLE